MRRGYFVLLVLVLALVPAIFAISLAPLGAALDWPSLAVVLAPGLIMGFASHAPKEIGRSYRVAFARVEATREELARAETYFDSLVRYLVCGGALGVASGFIAILLMGSMLADVQQVGRGLALCLLSALYAVLLVATVALPFRTAVRKRLVEAR